jgi:serine/threonine protein kinase
MDLSLQVGKYDVQKMLGKGTTGTVYLAKDTFTGKEVALKTIEPEVFRDPEFGTMYRSQFLQEASLAGKLRHPYIVSILDAVVGEDSGHIAMELVTGGDLSKHCTPETLLPVPDVLQIGFKCCGALEYAAKEGIVHRDIKPANIMLASGTEVKIADFGAAVLKKSQVKKSQVVTAALGSPYYMSPEQVDGGKALTFHSDMYSLGVVLYELLTGKRPFAGANLEDLIAKILKFEPLPPSEARPELPKSIDSVVLRALKKDPAQRYATWPEFALELAKAGELVLPPGAIPDSEKYVTLKSVPMLSTLADSELWELARAGRWRRVPKGKPVLQEDETGKSFFFLAKGEAKVTKNKKLLNMVNGGECFGEMAYIGTGDQRRHATVEAMTELLLAEFDAASLERMSMGAQLQLTRALVRNVTDRLALANVRLAR